MEMSYSTGSYASSLITTVPLKTGGNVGLFAVEKGHNVTVYLVTIQEEACPVQSQAESEQSSAFMQGAFPFFLKNHNHETLAIP